MSKRDESCVEILNNGFKPNYIMSQEEEKLIEEWKKIASEIDCPPADKLYIVECLRTAYRAGKLAGFEMCADSLDDIANNNSVMNNISSDFRKSYITISKSLREGYKSLIEEEKKKL